MATTCPTGECRSAVLSNPMLYSHNCTWERLIGGDEFLCATTAIVAGRISACRRSRHFGFFQQLVALPATKTTVMQMPCKSAVAVFARTDGFIFIYLLFIYLLFNHYLFIIYLFIIYLLIYYYYIFITYLFIYLFILPAPSG